jgi:small subunit ribosomal protein S6
MSRQDLTETQVKDQTEKYSAVVKEYKGKILKTEQWGLRTLAYKINKAKKAHYTLIEFEAPGEVVAELERRMRIDEDVLRTLTIRLDEATSGPSVMMKKYDNDDSNTDDEEKEAA